VAQGGDWGAIITELMGAQAPPELIGIHTNMPGVFPDEIDKAAFSGAPVPSGLSPDEKEAYERLQTVYPNKLDNITSTNSASCFHITGNLTIIYQPTNNNPG
jgi:hypothetical protein